MSRARVRTTSALIAALVVGATLAGQALAAGGGLKHVTPYSPTGTYAEGSSLPSGRLVDPVGRRTKTDDFPVAIVLSPDGRTAVVSNSGQGSGAPEQGDQSLQVIDVKSGKVVQTVRDREAGSITFYNAGLAFSRDGKHLYATGGGNDRVYDYAVSGQRLRLKARWTSSHRQPVSAGVRSTPLNGYLGNAFAYSRGLAVAADGAFVVVTNEQGSTVAALSTTDGSLLWETTLGGPAVAGGAYPGAVVLSADGGRAYVSAQGLNAVATLETATGALVGLTPVGDHPVALTRVGTTLLVANANDDSLSVVDVGSTGAPQQVDQLSTHLVPGEANGSTPDAVTADAARGLVFVALANDNAVMVLRAARTGKAYDFSRLAPAGFLPTGWYPTALAVGSDGRLLTAAAKGLGGAPITSTKQYIVNKRNGLLTTVSTPSAKDLARGTAKARALLLHPTRANTLRPKDSPIPTEATKGDSPIKHVVLVVRENRTFDQVFGDLTRKDADVEPAYVQFGERDKQGRTVTPNIHALARRFALSQNFYSDGEASIQGHHWVAAGISTDYTEKSYLHNYSDRNHPYDPVFGITYPRCGAVFQQLARQGKSFRNFGELVGLATTQTPTLQPAPGAACATPGGAYDAVSVANFSNVFGGNLSITAVNDTDKVKSITAELDPLIAAGRMPQFSMVFLGNDHTDGTKEGSKTPQAHVATNDEAVGQLVDHLSHSPVWPSTAVFVVEDDSQDGLDHRDGHRNILLVASPYAKKGALSSLHVSQASVLRTIELILGIEPLSSYTQYAAVPYDMFQARPDLTPYSLTVPTYPKDAKNGPPTPGTPASVPLDLSTFDVAGPVLEAQLWQATRSGEPVPAALLAMLRVRGGIREEAIEAWRQGRACLCRPLRDGLVVAPGGDTDG